MRIREHVEVRAQPTVVRLEESAAEAWVSEAYFVTDEARAHLETLRRTFAAPAGSGAFLIGAYGSGKSHFLAYLTQRLRASDLAAPAPAVATLSLLNYSAQARLEDVVAGALGITVGTGDRREGWSACLNGHPHGLVLLLDELSEFLRAKPDPQRFAEDIRFLQFMGEWASGRRLWIVAAAQEAIEHTGELEYGQYRKIRDRYPLRLRLTPAHVRDLVAGHLLRKGPGYAGAVAALARRVSEALPAAPRDLDGLVDVYPLHPMTLKLLEEVRDRFSQTRGVVEFVLRRLAGDAARGIEPFLDREWGEMLAPDAIVQHYADVLEVQAEFLPLAQKVLPWYREHLPELFEAERRRALAERLLRLLVLAWLCPGREGVTADEALWWLVFAPVRLDARRNREIVAATLERLATDGRWVRRDGDRFLLDLRDDGTADLDRQIRRELAQLPADAVILESLVEAMTGTAGSRPAFDPFVLPRDRWLSRSVRWHFHERPWNLWFGDGTPPRTEGPSLCVRLPWGEAAAAADCPTVRPAAVPVGPAARELAAMLRLRERPLTPEASVLVERRIAERVEVFAAQVRQAFAEAEVVAPASAPEKGPPPCAGDSHDAWLDAWAVWLLRRRYPAFERFAPAHGPLPHDAYRRFMRFAAQHDLSTPDVDQWVTVVREGYLVPMQLLGRSGRDYAIPARLDRHELVRLLRPLIEQGVGVQAVHEHLAQPVYGLLPDQIDLLLVFLLLGGEIDIVKADRSYRTEFETLPTPRAYERIVPGRSLGADALRSLERLCDALRIQAPVHWTVQAQRRAVQRVRETLRGFSGRLGGLRPRLDGHGALIERLERFRGACATLDRGGDELSAFDGFLAEVESASAFVARLDELLDLPERFDRWAAELRRFEHLFGQPGGDALAADLGPPPSLDAGPAVDAWLARARAAHETIKRTYKERHDAFWRDAGARAAWSWQPPALAACRHLGLDSETRALAEARAAAERARCRGLSNLDFQARCACGFDGTVATASEALAAFDEAHGAIARELTRFCARPEVREAVRSWAEQGIERSAGTTDYIEGRAPWPEIHDVRAFGEHLSGIEVVRREPLESVVRVLVERSWEREPLLRALDAFLRGLGVERVRFEAPPAREADAVAVWCVEQALRHGASLPAGLGETAGLAGRLEPEWVGAAALARLESLGLDPACLERVVQLVVERRVRLPSRRSPLVAAAAELIEPTTAGDPEALAALAERLYEQHELLARVAAARWLDRLNGLAESALEPAPADLPAVLGRHRDAEWIVIDGLGLPLLPALREALDDLLPGRRAVQTTFALAPAHSTTDAFYDELLRGEVRRGFRKIDVVDELLHRRALAFADLRRLAIAELQAAFGEVRRRVPPAAAVLLFSDHGFRLDRAGRGWTHGGPSTLERTVPVTRLEPGKGATQGPAGS